MVAEPFLVLEILGRLCAIPVREAIEVLRPLPVERLVDVPDFVLGVSMIRGEATPIVDLGIVVAGEALHGAERLVSMRGESGRRVALLVNEVAGLFGADRLQLSDAPPMLRNADLSRLSALGRLDGALLTVLELGRLVPDSVWRSLEGEPE